MAALPLFIYIERRTIYPARVYTYLIRPGESKPFFSFLDWANFFSSPLPSSSKRGNKKKGQHLFSPQATDFRFSSPSRAAYVSPSVYLLFGLGPATSSTPSLYIQTTPAWQEEEEKKGLLLVYIPPSLFGVSSYRHQHFPYTLQHRYYSSTDRGSLEIDSTNGSDPLCNIKRFYFQTTAGMVVISSCATLGSNGELILIPSAAGPTFRKKRRQLTWA